MITLSFFFKKELVTTGGEVLLQISYDDGDSWENLVALNLWRTDEYIQSTYYMPTHATSKMHIRFLGTGLVNGYLYIDNFQIDFTLPEYPNRYLGTTSADMLYAKGLSGQGITVAVVDSGVDDHYDLAGRLVATPLGDGDYYGHGTHVSGIVAGDGSWTRGAYRGIAPGVDLIGLKVSDSNGLAYESDVVNALQWVYDHKSEQNIRVVNLSLNSTVEDSYHNSPLDAAVEILWFHGVVVVASAGNKGPAGGYNTARTAPANDPFIITVGASDEHGTSLFSDDSIAPFSSFGNTLDGYSKPDILAPGYNILSALSEDSFWNTTYPDRIYHEKYIRLSGTSMAAPMVTGAVALLLQDEPELTPDQVKYRLLNSTQRYLSDESGNTYPYLDIYAAVQGTTTESANTGQIASQLLWSGAEPVTWGSVAWNSVAWNSVAWNSVAWNSVAWNSVYLDGIFWGPNGRSK